MTTETQPKQETQIVPTDRSALAPTKVGGVMVPRTVEALEQLLEATKSKAWPLPFRADILPPDAQILLYSIGGIPAYVPPNYVMIFAGRPYLSADGVIDTAIDQGCSVYTDRHLEIVGCLDPQSGCPGEIKKGNSIIRATAQDSGYIATAHVTKPGGGRFTTYAQCCAHTWQGAAQHRPQMARTRALRNAAKRALGIPSGAIRDDDDPETPRLLDESLDPVPDPVQASTDGDTGAADNSTDGPAQAPKEEAAAPVSAKPKGTLVGRLNVEPAGEGPWQAQAAGELRTKEQCDEAIALLAKLDLHEGALAVICKKRYGGVELTQASKVALDELNRWLESQVAVVSAFNTPDDSAPPF